MKTQRKDLRELMGEFFIDPSQSTQDILLTDIIQYGYDIRSTPFNSPEEKMLDPDKGIT